MIRRIRVGVAGFSLGLLAAAGFAFTVVGASPASAVSSNCYPSCSSSTVAPQPISTAAPEVAPAASPAASPSVEPTASSSGSLAFTGADIAETVVIGLALVAVGTLIVVRVRRRPVG
jgi:hypothetical protein